MNFGWVKPLLIRSRQWAVRNAPHILMGMGTTSSVAGLIFAVKATPAAMDAVTEAKESKGEALKPVETVKACGKYYIPAVGMEVFSLLCFWTAHGVNMRRQAVLAGLYSTAEQALIEYQRKVVEMVGETPEREIRNAVAQDHVDRDPPPAGYIIDKETDHWCYYKGYRFPSSWYKLHEIQNNANEELIQNLYLSERELLYMFDPDGRYIRPDPGSGMTGFSVDRLMKFDIHPCMTPDHEPAFEVEITDKDGRHYDPFPGYSASL